MGLVETHARLHVSRKCLRPRMMSCGRCGGYPEGGRGWSRVAGLIRDGIAVYLKIDGEAGIFRSGACLQSRS